MCPGALPRFAETSLCFAGCYFGNKGVRNETFGLKVRGDWKRECRVDAKACPTLGPCGAVGRGKEETR